MTILGINPGSRYWGIAVLRGARLSDWRIRTISGTSSAEKLSEALRVAASLMEEYAPDVLAIKQLHPSRSSPGLRRLVEGMKELAEKRGLRVYQHSVEELEATFCSRERPNRRKLAEVLASEYPALFHELIREKRNRNPYHLRMFEAVALASACFHQLDKQ